MCVLNEQADFQGGVGQVQHLGALLGERTTGDRTGDHMSERRDFDAGQRALGVGERRKLRFAVADLHDLDQRCLSQDFTLRVGVPFLRRAAHRTDHAALGRRVLQVEGVPLGDGVRNRPGVQPALEQSGPVQPHTRVDRRGQIPAVVSCGINVERHSV